MTAPPGHHDPEHAADPPTPFRYLRSSKRVAVRPTDVVTGAFGQTGAAIARLLLARGRRVKTITRAPPGSDPAARIEVVPPSFDDPTRLGKALRGCSTLYSTYWARFGIGGDFAPLVSNSRILFDAARDAGVRRVVLVSVAHADPGSPLPYWRGKGRLEEVLRDAGVAHTIVRPTLIYGPHDTLVHNAAWTMRRLHALPVPRAAATVPVRPVHVDDVAALCVRGARSPSGTVVDTVGPERFTYVGFLRAICDRIGARCIFPRAPTGLILAGAAALRPFVHDVVATRNEMESVALGLLGVRGRVNCPTRFTAWLSEHAATVGQRYHSQVRRARGLEYPCMPSEAAA